MKPCFLLPRAFLLLSLFLLAQCQLLRMPIEKIKPQISPVRSHFLNFKSSESPKNIANYWSIEYVGIIHLGPERKEFRVLLDTGSAPLWIPNASIAQNLSSSHHTFNCSESKTCKSVPENVYNISYGMGSILGTEIIEDVQIGAITVSQYNMLLASDIKYIPNLYYDGIMGLSLGRWSYLNQFPTLLESLKMSGAISTGMFSMYLGNDPDAVGNMTGELIFGGYDPKYADSDFQFVHLESGNKTLLWTTNMSSLCFGAKKMSDITNFPVIFDSGGSLSIFPKSFIDNILQEAEKFGVNFTLNNMTNNYHCDCKAQEILPDLYFYFENATFNLKASSYILSNYGNCYLGLLVLRENISLYTPAVLGDVFLKDYYALYTLDNNTVGLAKAKVFEKNVVNEPGNLGWKALIFVVVILVVIGGGFAWAYQRKKGREVEDYIQAGSEYEYEQQSVGGSEKNNNAERF